ncbi:MAG: RluA family pseudouridine synthase [Bacteroidetes bacterium]|nr:RluA family pseudouridine synthase [Rhodothermia bacterium]MCS7155673.1 RluA family pseudouridine synthase [Bacteroidota bacterium]MCX7906532.1 RluA family pseudouridine synthase [Bacteroidota bacterium]MDW8137187.1 RluA family pseudouridine synthase [Bacteroidota bacterium]MDW8284943.1 RluA family pseudouridine synthase [Bacteroidota bacterium]
MLRPPMAEVRRVVLEVPAGYRERERLDLYIARRLEHATRSRVQAAIAAGLVRVSGELATRAGYRVRAGDRIEVMIPKPPPPEVRPEPMELDIRYEDAYLLVLNKPPGVVVHPAFGHWSGTLVNGLLAHVGRLSGLNDPVLRPGIVHRLDKDTSGLLLVAKDEGTHANLARQFQLRTLERRYWALVWGHPEPEGEISAPIGRDPRDRKRMAVLASGKPAVTRYRVLERYEALSLLELRLLTGRTHQIRVHCAWLGHPVFGDPVYGGRTLRYGAERAGRRAAYQALLERLPRQALHARTLGFRHPVTGQWLQFAADPPEDMAEVMELLRRMSHVPSEDH